MRVLGLLSGIAANRKRFFELVAALEAESSCAVDVLQLTALIDAHFSGREELLLREARELLMAVSYPVQDIPERKQGGEKDGEHENGN